MANYNYVAPTQFKSYSEWYRERRTENEARKLASLQQQTGLNKQRQKYVDKLDNVDTTNWAEADRAEYRFWRNEAKVQILTDPNPPYSDISESLIEMQTKGDQHAKIYEKGHSEYMTHLGPDALPYSGKVDYGMEADYSADDLKAKDDRFNYLGLEGYNSDTRIGFFSNPEYNPTAEEGTPGSYKTLADLALSQTNEAGEPLFQIETGPDGKAFYMKDGKKVYVSGTSFDSPDRGNAGIYNPPIVALNSVSPEIAYDEYTTNLGGKHFAKIAKGIRDKVRNGEMGREEGEAVLKEDFLQYVDPEGFTPSSSLSASAIELWEQDTQTDYNGDGNITEATAITVDAGTPWEHYVNQMIKHANIFETGSGDDGAMTATEAQIAAIRSRGTLRPDTQFSREMQAPEFNWDIALRDTTADLSEIFEEEVVYENGRPKKDIFGDIVTTKKLKENKLKKGARINMGGNFIKFDGVFIDNIEVFPEENIIIVYSTSGIEYGDPGAFGQTGKPSAPWTYQDRYGGKSGVAPFIIIDYEGEEEEDSDSFERLKATFEAKTKRQFLLDNLISNALLQNN